MGLFSRGKSGGMMNVIRCDQENYIIWKWRPEDQEVNTTSRENAIRWNSSLRVKDGEVAIFVYQQKNAAGTIQDVIVGPHDQRIMTDNFPILASLVGLGWGGESPFQAEVYFINTAGVVQMKFAVPYFSVSDPRFPDMPVPVAAIGNITYCIEDYMSFIKLHRLINFTPEDLQQQVTDAVTRRVKKVLSNAPFDHNTPLTQIDRKITEIADSMLAEVAQDFARDFGLKVKRLDLTEINIDKESPEWATLLQLTAQYQAEMVRTNQENAIETARVQNQLNLDNMAKMQQVNLRNMEESMAIQRQEMQRAQQAQTETAEYAAYLQSQQQNLAAFTTGQQAQVLGAAAESLGQMGSMDFGAGGGGGMNPVGMMTGMMMGGAMGQQMAGMMNQMGNQMANGQNGAQPGNTPPPLNAAPGGMPPQMPQNIQYYVGVNGNQAGPFNAAELMQLAQAGQLTTQTLVWTQGMANWDIAGNQPALQTILNGTPGTPSNPGAGTPPQMPPQMP